MYQASLLKTKIMPHQLHCVVDWEVKQDELANKRSCRIKPLAVEGVTIAILQEDVE
jgi:hypothetical protein